MGKIVWKSRHLLPKDMHGTTVVYKENIIPGLIAIILVNICHVNVNCELAGYSF